jgi:anti-sigma factor RsiW
MDCAKAKEYLGPYIDEALPAQYVRELEQHLQGCTDCAFELAQLRALSAALRSLPPAELPPGFTAAFREKLAAEPKPKPVPVPQRGWARVLAPAALLVLVAGVVSLWGNANRARNYGGLGLAPAAAPEMVMSMTVASEPWMAPAPS